MPSWVPTSGFIPAGEGAVDKTSFIVDVANEAFAALDESGYVKADFLPYFDPVPPATTDMPDVYVSAYRRDDGRALVIVSNAGKDDRQGRVSINAERLNLPLSNVYTWPNKEPLSVHANSVHMHVPRLDYRMLVVAAP